MRLTKVQTYHFSKIILCVPHGKKAFQCRHLTKWNFTTTHTYEHNTEPCLLCAHNALVENNICIGLKSSFAKSTSNLMLRKRQKTILCKVKFKPQNVRLNSEHFEKLRKLEF